MPQRGIVECERADGVVSVVTLLPLTIALASDMLEPYHRLRYDEVCLEHIFAHVQWQRRKFVSSPVTTCNVETGHFDCSLKRYVV